MEDTDYSLIQEIQEENRLAQLDSETRVEVELARISQAFISKALATEEEF